MAPYRPPRGQVAGRTSGALYHPSTFPSAARQRQHRGGPSPFPRPAGGVQSAGPGGVAPIRVQTRVVKPPNLPTPAAPDPFALLRSQAAGEFDRQRTSMQDYGAGVGNWLTGAVNPLAVANAAAQQNYTNSVRSAAPAAPLPGVSVQGAGGMTANPFPWVQQAEGIRGVGQGQAAIAQADINSLLNTTGLNNAAQGIYGNLASQLLNSTNKINQDKTNYLQKLDELVAQNSFTASQNAAQQAALDKRQQNDLAQSDANAKLVFAAQALASGVKLKDINLDFKSQMDQHQTQQNIADANNQTKTDIANLDRQSRERIAKLQAQNRMAVQKYKSAHPPKAGEGAKNYSARIRAATEADTWYNGGQEVVRNFVTGQPEGVKRIAPHKNPKDPIKSGNLLFKHLSATSGSDAPWIPDVMAATMGEGNYQKWLKAHK